MAAVVIGGCAVSVVTRKPPHVPTVTQNHKATVRAHDVDNHEEWLPKASTDDNFKSTDDQVMTIRKFTFSGVHFEKAKEKFENFLDRTIKNYGRR
jgi:hypothetical protein